MKLSLKDKLKRLVSKKSVDRTIDGEVFTFHPISLMMLSEMGEVFAPVITAVRMLMNEAKPRAVTTETSTSADGSKTQVVHASEMSVELVRLVEEQESAAVNSAIKCVLGAESRHLLVKVLASSLRIDEDEVAESMEVMDLGTLGQFLAGFLEANGKVLGPFVEQAKAWFKSKTRSLRLVANDNPGEAQETGAAGSPSPSLNSESLNPSES